MVRLINRYELSIDDKGRLVLPAPHRERYADGAVLASRGDHIAVYEPAVWDDFVALLTERRINRELTRTDFNLITMHAADLQPDSAGRIVIPAWMRQEIGLEDKALVAGVTDYLAIYPGMFLSSVGQPARRGAFEKIDEMGL